MPSRAFRNVDEIRKLRTYIAIAGVTLVILITTLAIAGREQTFRCDRLNTGEVECVIKQSLLGVITLNSTKTTGVRALTIGEQCAGADCKFRLELYSAQGIVPVSENYTSNYAQLLDIYNRFSTFFDDTKNTNMQMKEETNPILIAGIVAVCVLIWGYLGYLIWQLQHPSLKKQAVKS